MIIRPQRPSYCSCGGSRRPIRFIPHAGRMYVARLIHYTKAAHRDIVRSPATRKDATDLKMPGR